MTCAFFRNHTLDYIFNLFIIRKWMTRIMKLIIFCITCILAYNHVTCIPQFTRLTETYHKFDVDFYDRDIFTLTCNCIERCGYEIDLDRNTIHEILTVCDSPLVMLKECRDCLILDEKCIPVENEKLFKCTKSTFTLEEGTIVKDCHSEIDENNRVKRAIKPITCKSPIRMRSADISCTTTKGIKTCILECIQGYTFKEGRKMTYECKTFQNKWEPSNFMECEPYIDCTATLISPGSIHCYPATTKNAAICYIECEKYSHHNHISRRAYTCKDEDEWRLDLPFCVKAGSNIALVPPPPKSSE